VEKLRLNQREKQMQGQATCTGTAKDIFTTHNPWLLSNEEISLDVHGIH